MLALLIWSMDMTNWHFPRTGRLRLSSTECWRLPLKKIQLFGTAEEIGYLYAFIDEWARREAAGQRPSGNIDSLLKALRNRLREELSLPPVPADREAIRGIRPEAGAQEEFGRGSPPAFKDGTNHVA